MSYRLSPTGHRNALVLLLGAICVWVFAFWALQNTLGTVPGEELSFFAALERNLAAGLTLSQIIPALLMIVLIVATPLVFWNILAEYAATYTPGDDGLRYESIGVVLLYPWNTIDEITMQQDGGETSYELHFNRDMSAQIGNPLLRLLHVQSAGRRALRIPSGVVQQRELIATISALSTAVTNTKQNVEDANVEPNKPHGAGGGA